ncbi:ribonuclease T2 family protein [Sphingomonas solaris]|uniref:Ribonuclease T n=1 Tax=Alterirhizorhabdus solaris TaxID=2529389 RepID=A0A558QYW7_9SPHN|nr:ribonuclease T [Sphingomonas solaris]TVV72346.1 ribonuclease T [Sphingomonas solaris]
MATRWLLPLLLALPAAAHAQARECAVPDVLPKPRLEAANRDNPRRLMPTGGYTLAVSWSPGYCFTRQASARDAFQCGGGNVPFGFVLHGLWPDGEGETWPQYCRPARAVPEAVIRQTLCATPSVQLIQHEWAKHGTCMSPDPKSYFSRATGLYRVLRFPDMAALARRKDLTTAAFARAFAAVNRGIPASAVRVTTGKGGWLDELWLCMDRRLRYAACRAGKGGGDVTRLRITRPA